MAHGLLQSFDSKLEVFSAGTKPAEKVNPMAVKVMTEIGIDLAQHTPKSVNLYVGKKWDYVITVCGGANESCPMFTGEVKTGCILGLTTHRKQPEVRNLSTMNFIGYGMK